MLKRTTLLLIVVFFMLSSIAYSADLSDIQNHWGKHYIEELVERGIITGYPDGTFQPDQPISRAAFIKLLVVSLGVQGKNQVQSPFSDVSQSAWSYPYIITAIENNLLVPSDYPNDKFSPNLDITRLEMAILVSRALGLTESVTPVNFTDSDKIPQYALNHVSKVVDKGIITGFPDGSFQPFASATRAQASVIISRFLNVKQEKFLSEQETTPEKLEQVSYENKVLTTKEIVHANDKKIVVIVTYFNGEPLSQGSGIAIKDGFFATNYHVMEGAEEAYVYTIDGETYDVEGIAFYNSDADLAIIKTTTKTGIEPVKIGNIYDVQKGDPIVTIGSPKGLQNTVSEGIVSGLRNIDNINYIQITAPITHGSSGGALFNDNGEIIGITTLGYEGGANLNFAVSIEYVKEILGTTLSKSFSSIDAEFLPFSHLDDKSDEIYLPKVQKLLNEEYSQINTSKKNIKVNGYNVYRNDDGVIYINGFINIDEYIKYTEQLIDVEDEIREWAKNLGNKLDEMFPQEEVSLMIMFEDYFEVFPGDIFEVDEIEYVPELEKWLVVHWIIYVQLTTEKIYWDVRF